MNQRGFTLIEVIVYIALFSILIGSAFVIAFQLIDNSGKLSAKNTTQAEGNFILRKLDWALTGIDPALTPTISGSGCSQAISIPRSDSSVNPVDIRLDNAGSTNYIEMRENGGTYAAISTANVSVSCLKFQAISGTPAGITATATIDGQDFTITKYIRK